MLLLNMTLSGRFVMTAVSELNGTGGASSLAPTSHGEALKEMLGGRVCMAFFSIPFISMFYNKFFGRGIDQLSVVCLEKTASEKQKSIFEQFQEIVDGLGEFGNDEGPYVRLKSPPPRPSSPLPSRSRASVPSSCPSLRSHPPSRVLVTPRRYPVNNTNRNK